MAERPPPESIRGSWYYLIASADPHDVEGKHLQMFRFRLNGTFSRYVPRDEVWAEKEKGEYTFDGAFLIIRGRNTDTFRVRCDTFWRWTLEGRKDEQVLLRGLVTADDFIELSEEDQKEVRILPIRVAVRVAAEHDEAVFDLVHKERTIGTFFVEQSGGQLWVGVSTFVDGIEPRTWERIIRESYLDIFRSKPSDVQVVTVRLLNSGESRVFKYTV